MGIPGETQAALIALWAFDEGSGTTTSDSVGSRTGTLTGSPAWVTGRVGASALHFDGATQFVEATLPFNDAVYSWAMWLQGDTVPTVGVCCTFPLINGRNTDSWGFAWNHSDPAFAQAAHHRNAAGAYVAAKIQTTLSAGIWYHIAATYDGTNLKIYLNGSLEATTPASVALTASGTVRLGQSGNAGDVVPYGFPGRLDDVQVYNTALTAGEVATLYTSGGGAGPPTALLKCTTPLVGMSGTGWPLRPYAVFVADLSGNVGPSFFGTVTASLASAPGGGTLTGTTAVAAASTTVPGIGLVWAATFTNLIVTGEGTYQLSFAASGMTSCTTNAFTVGASFHLGVASPARGFGLSLPGVIVTDFDGYAVAQSGAIDVGALQYRSNAAPLVVPPPLNFRLGP